MMICFGVSSGCGSDGHGWSGSSGATIGYAGSGGHGPWYLGGVRREGVRRVSSMVAMESSVRRFSQKEQNSSVRRQPVRCLMLERRARRPDRSVKKNRIRLSVVNLSAV